MNFLKNYKNILCIFSHPDDETLGAGGLLSVASENKIRVNIAFSNTGIMSRNDVNKKNYNLKKLHNDTYNALSLFKITKNKIVFGEFPDNMSDSIPLLKITQWVEKIIKKINPDLILTHHRHCTNIDHRLLHEAVITATRPNEKNKVDVLSCEILSSTGYLRPTNFEPTLYLNLSKKHLNQKIRALKKYKTEIRNYPHPRSLAAVKALSMIRGTECGSKFAEAYIINKIISV